MMEVFRRKNKNTECPEWMMPNCHCSLLQVINSNAIQTCLTCLQFGRPFDPKVGLVEPKVGAYEPKVDAFDPLKA